MAKTLNNVRILYGGLDITGSTNSLDVGAQRPEVDVTNYDSIDSSGVVWKEFLAGLGNANWSFEGFGSDTVNPDDEFWARDSNVPVTAIPLATSYVENALTYQMRAVRTSYAHRLPVGEAVGFGLTLVGDAPMTRGRLLATTSLTGAGNSTGYQLGAISATQKGYFYLHVTATGGTGSPTVTVTIESDDNSGFTTPTTRATFTTVDDTAALAFDYATVAGAVTDDWWRAAWTVGGTTQAFTIHVAGAIF